MDELFETKIKENVTESRLLNVRVSASDTSVLTQIRTSTQRTSFFGNLVFSVQFGKDENRMRTEVSLYKFLGKDVIIKKNLWITQEESGILDRLLEWTSSGFTSVCLWFV